MQKKYLPLILIVLLAAVLRLTSLTQFPSGLNADEAALGYNAYSLLLTGRDEHGHIMPINLESFGDFKPALYSYLLVPLVKVFGLTEFTVRLPSALFGVLAVLFIYYLAYLTTRNKTISLLSALILTISPWHLHFSRGAWEVNLATTLIMLGVIYFLKWKNSHHEDTSGGLFSGGRSLVISLALFSLSMYSYQSARIISPLLGLALAAIFRAEFFAQPKKLVLPGVMLTLFLLPLGLSLVFSDAASRVGGVGLMADEGPLNFVKELRGQHSGPVVMLGKLIHNRPVIYSLQFVKNYLAHFDGNFLFVNGDIIERNRVPETGLLYLTDSLLLIAGILYFVRSRRKVRGTTVLFLWLAVAPVASALTFQVPHALRAQNMIIPLSILLAAGIVNIFSLSSSKKILGILAAIFIVSYSWQFSRYLHQYYVHYPKMYPAAWQYGFKDLVSYVQQNQDRYSEILVTTRYDQPYALFLFYLKYPPADFQAGHTLTFRDRFNFSTVPEFSKYRFLDTSWESVRDRHSSLIIAAPDNIPEVGVNIVKTFYFPNGEPAFKIVSN